MKQRKGESLEEYHARVAENDREEGIEGEEPVIDKRLAPLAAKLDAVMGRREEAILEDFGKEIDLLAVPQRERAPKIAPDGPAINDRSEGIVSRNQPSDSLYRTLHNKHPHFKECRTADLDHWNAEWLKAYWQHDYVTMRMAAAKADECARATTLGGDLSGTGVTDGTGGHILPQQMSNLVQIARDAAAVIAPLCTNFTTEGLTLRVPTSGAVTADTIAEGASGAQGEPTFASEMLILHKIGVRMIASEEMLMDSAFNLMGIYGQRAGEGIGAAEDLQICTTDGSTPNLTEAICKGPRARSARPGSGRWTDHLQNWPGPRLGHS